MNHSGTEQHLGSNGRPDGGDDDVDENRDVSGETTETDSGDEGYGDDLDEDRNVPGETVEAGAEIDHLHLAGEQEDEETVSDYSLSPNYRSPSPASPGMAPEEDEGKWAV